MGEEGREEWGGGKGWGEAMRRERESRDVVKDWEREGKEKGKGWGGKEGETGGKQRAKGSESGKE